jgi:hypothetical protein
LQIKKEDLEWAVSQDLISTSQVEPLWQRLSEKTVSRPRFDLVHVLYYFGALIVIGAMGWFMTDAWEVFGGGIIFLISVIYAATFIGVGSWLWHRDGLQVPGGLFVTMGVCMTPLAMYGLQRWLGIWAFDDPGEYTSFHRWIKGGWFCMEVATIGVSLVALQYIKFPFLTAPIAFTFWYMSMDLTPIIFGDDHFSWEQRQLVSLWFGLAMIVGTYFVDHRTKKDFAFWGYLFGAIAFWGGLSLMKSDSELSKFFYLLINLLLMGLSVFLQRRIFVIFGAIGSFGYIGYIASKIFENSMLFPFVLIVVGLMVLYCGILLHRHGKKIEQKLISAMPEWMKGLRPSARGAL